jgi:hypothetical protein
VKAGEAGMPMVAAALIEPEGDAGTPAGTGLPGWFTHAERDAGQPSRAKLVDANSGLEPAAGFPAWSCMSTQTEDTDGSIMKHPSPDRSKIAVDREDEIKHWAKHLGVAEETLRQTIEKVGNAAAAVRKELRNRDKKKIAPRVPRKKRPPKVAELHLARVHDDI